MAYVDGLRAIAVLSVVVHHAAKYDLTLPFGTLRHALLEGAHGVDLFFVISGFCLSFPTLAHIRAEGAADFDVARYWARRLVRILPPFWVALALFGVGGITLAGAKYGPPSPAWIAPESWSAFASQALLLDKTAAWANGSFWTLAIEFRWYFLFPVLLAVWVRSPRLFWAIAAASFVAFHFTRLAELDFATLPAFMFGIVAADVALRKPDAWRLAVPGFAVSVATALIFEHKTSDGFYQQTQTGWQVAAFCLVVAAGTMPSLRRAFSIYPLAVIGLASYSIYLVHEPVIAFLETYGTFSSASAAGIAIAVGLLFWRLFEWPIAQGSLRDRVVARIEPPVRRAMRWLAAGDRVKLSSHSPEPPVQAIA